MTRLAIAFVAALLVTGALSGVGEAKPEKAGKAKAADKAAPTASASELDKLKGDYKWGMTPDEVVGKVQERLRATYDEKLKKSAQDPTRHDRIRKEMIAESDKLKGKVIKFDGQTTGYDVSIIDQEFVQNSGESMLTAKEDTATRYFFFKNERLYKMFIALDKEILQGKSFRDFGKLMQARFGKAKEVTVEEKSKAGVQVKLDHFVWGSKSGDKLRLVDRSEFYDVYCLVIYDGNVEKEQEAIRLSRRTGPKQDALVEAVTAKTANDLDPNVNVLDEITGKKVAKPGEEVGKAIVVQSPNAPTSPPAVRAPTPAEVNRANRAAKSAAPSEPAGEGEGEGKGKAGKKSDGKGKVDGLKL
jgi:hypothetical protein